jgi:hypothetical protein
MGRRGTITALAIIALVFLLLLWSPLLLTGDARLGQSNVTLALPVEMLVLTIGAIACALAAADTGLRRQFAWAGRQGAIAVAAAVALVYFFIFFIVHENVSAAPLSDALVALMIFLGTATPPVAALIYGMASRNMALQEEDVCAPTATPA